MEPSRSVHQLPSAEDFFRRLAKKGYEPRVGQRKFWDVLSTVNKNTYLAVLPTGYGKSDTALGAYLIAREQSRVNRMLIVVPSDTQRQQYVNDLIGSVARMGGTLSVFKDGTTGKSCAACLVRHEISDWRLTWENKCEIFVTTVQSVLSDESFYRELMKKGKWFTFFDEYHKLNREEAARWGKAALGVQGEIIIGMTATPVRSDNSPTIFDGTTVDVVVSFRDAYREKAIRGVIAHVEHYFVDMLDSNGNPERITTETLRNVQNFDDYQVRRDLRFIADYLSSMLSAAHDCMVVKNLRHTGQHQMLVFAMNLDHAQHVSGLLNAVYGAGFSDWVGVRRNDAENDNVLTRYQENRLPCLVQVDKATEGFNNKRASVLVFLNLLRKNTIKAIQGAGRGVRRNGAIAEFTDDVCDMFASADTEMADLIQEFAKLTVGSDQDDPASKEPKNDTPDERNGPLFVIPPFESCVLAAEYDRSEIIQVSEPEIQAFREVVLQEVLGASKGKLSDDQFAILRQDFSDERLGMILRKKKIDEMKEAMAAVDNTVITRTNVQKAVQTLAGNLVRHIHGKAAHKDLIGDIAKRINQRWLLEGGRTAKGSLYEDLRKKYDWVRDINVSLRSKKEVPEWLAI